MSAGAFIPPSKCDLRKVNQVQFEIWKEKQIKAHAACVVETAKSFHNGIPVRGGLSDLRMGTTDFKLKCETCNQAYNECPGHFGMIELAEPMFNIGVFDVVLQALKCVCKSCGTLLADRDNAQFADAQANKKGSNRLRAMVALKKNKCHERTDESGKHGCDATQPNVARFLDIYPGLVVKVNFEDQEQRWYADKVYDIFDKISDADARLMGFDPIRCHPRDLLITVLPVPPPHVRPSVAFGSAKSENELTHKLNSILKENTELRKLKANHLDTTGIENVRIRLQEHIGTYFHNGSTYYKPSKMSDTAQLKSLTERLKGKYGRLRGNLMGKRVDFSARTVITGDPNIDVDEVGVPFSIAMTLTFPERVNAINKKRLTEFVRRPNYPSANYIIHENGQKIKLGMLKSRDKVNLKIGDVVERHVINGDVVLFNRQPTLHRMSMMGHRVRVLNYNTFRLNLSCTTPYNADFDGDEMNLHVPQSLLNKAELMEMMMVPKNFVSPNKSAPCMGIVQDSLLGCFRLTDKETFLDKIFVQSVAMWIDVWELPCPAILKPRPLWTGKQIFSLILPEVNVHNDTDHSFSHEDKMLLIRRGQLLCGSIKKGIVGAAAGSLIHVIFNEKGSDEVARFINGVQRVTAFFLINFSFSVGVQDTMADPDTLHHINQVLVKAREEVRGIGACANMGTLQRKAGMTLLQSFEKDVNTALNKCRDDSAKKALSKVRRTNSFKCMIEAGSKGSDLNIQQIAVFVGQQNVGGQRIPFGFRRRTLPHFCLDDYGESSRGMATRGYVEGLKPHEFFFHTMAGREGLIDTAVKTADTGYLQRKLIKALEDVHAAYDGTVRNANQDIIQFMYGEDGLDGARIEGSQGFGLPMMTDAQLADTYRYEYTDDGEPTANLGGNYMDPHTKKLLRADPENIKRLEEEFAQLKDDRTRCRDILELSEKLKISLPGNVERLIRNAQSTMGQRSKVSDLSPISVISEVRKLQEDLVQLFPSYNKGAHRMFLSHQNRDRIESALCLFNIHLRQMLGSKRVIKEYKLNSKAFEFLLSEIRAKYLQGIIHPGEMIGAMAAQSCGEPATQMTLNTFHNAGISSKNVTLGVPRLLELLNVSKNQKNTSMLITLVEGHNERKQAQKAQHRIEYCTLGHLVRRLQIIYDPDVLESVVEEDREFIQAELEVHEDAQRCIDEVNAASPWVLRLELDHNTLVDKHIAEMDIRAAFRERFPEDFLVESSMSNEEDDVPIVRIRPKKNLGNDAVPSLKSQIPEILGKIHLAGIKGVKKAILKELDTFTEDKETGAMAKKKPWAIDTEGTALKQVFIGLLDNASGTNIIDFTKTSSNKIPEVLLLLGIEAARYKMYLELREAYLAYGVVINYRHYMILVDTMCQRGYLMAVSRVGINRSDASGPLMRCSFEETVKVLMGAAAFGERDPVRGVSSNIMLGNQARIGTGLFDLMIDLQALRSAVPQEDAIAPGREVNVYHGMASIEQASPSVPYAAGSTMHTPRATDASVFGRHGGQLPSASMPYAASDFASQGYGAAMDFSVIPSADPYHAAGSDPFAPYSRGGASDGFVARNIDSAMLPLASDATFNFASSAPYSASYGGDRLGNRSGVASVNHSPSYATASAYSPAASSVHGSVGARYVPVSANTLQSGSHYGDSARYPASSAAGSEQYLPEAAPQAEDTYVPLGDDEDA